MARRPTVVAATLEVGVKKMTVASFDPSERRDRGISACASRERSDSRFEAFANVVRHCCCLIESNVCFWRLISMENAVKDGR